MAGKSWVGVCNTGAQWLQSVLAVYIPVATLLETGAAGAPFTGGEGSLQLTGHSSPLGRGDRVGEICD
jgi:hypothetical protein